MSLVPFRPNPNQGGGRKRGNSPAVPPQFPPPRLRPTLSDAAIKRAVPGPKKLRMGDGDGLCLLVMPNGAKWWRFHYHFGGKRKEISLGTYPEVPLIKARERRRIAREHVAAGRDPSAVRSVDKAKRHAAADETFEAVAREWLPTQTYTPSTVKKLTTIFDTCLFPVIGKSPLVDLTPAAILVALRQAEARGTLDTAHRARQLCGQVFRYGIATSRVLHDPSAGLRGALKPVRHAHHPSVMDPKAIGVLLRAIDSFTGTKAIGLALKMLALTFVRPGELRGARWSEFDLRRKVWTIPAARTKLQRDHVVPLSRQALAVLKDLRKLSTGTYIFPAINRSRSSTLSPAAMNHGLRRLGYDKATMTPHGFRSMARTHLDETLRCRPEIIEVQLAHMVPGLMGDTYNRAKWLEERTRMMQRYADYLDTLKASK